MKFRKSLHLARRAGARSPCRGVVTAQTLNVVTAGDQNMVDYVNNYLAPKFEAMNPGVKVRAVGTGPGDVGLAEDLRKALRATEGGIRRVGHRRRRRASARRGDDGQRKAADAVSQRHRRRQAGLARHARRTRWAPTSTATCCRCSTARSRSRTTRISSRHRRSRSPSLHEWVKKNPKQFGYNGVKGGMSGVGFVMGWVNANGGLGDKLEKGPYDPAQKAAIDKSLASLKDFNQYVVMTPGNAGHARHAEPRRDRDGTGVGRHVLHVAGRRQDEPEDQACRCRRRACRASRCIT